MEGNVAMRIQNKISEKGQSITLFALMLPLMAVFILGLFDYMVTNAHTMEAVAVADLSAHAGAQEIRLLPNGKILSDVPSAESCRGLFSYADSFLCPVRECGLWRHSGETVLPRDSAHQVGWLSFPAPPDYCSCRWLSCLGRDPRRTMSSYKF
jgi:hypothetical protein